MKTYPEITTFQWEEKPRLSLSLVYSLLKKSIKQRGSAPRKAAYVAVVHALQDIEHEHDPEFIPTAKLKQMLILAAQEHGWYAQDMRTLRTSQPPLPEAPEGMKCCRKCREVLPKAEFMAAVSPARARSYGWDVGTSQKRVSHLCGKCRKAKQQYESRRNLRSSLKKSFDKKTLRDDPVLERRIEKCQKLINQLRIHADRVRAAFTNARKVIHLPEGDVWEYQFQTDALRQFYESKRAMVKAAQDRVDALFGETDPVPDTWGMLLTREEQAELSNLHMEACLSCQSHRTPSLWKTENVKPKQKVRDE